MTTLTRHNVARWANLGDIQLTIFEWMTVAEPIALVGVVLWVRRKFGVGARELLAGRKLLEQVTLALFDTTRPAVPVAAIVAKRAGQ